jgi:hypothetical protein
MWKWLSITVNANSLTPLNSATLLAKSISLSLAASFLKRNCLLLQREMM